MLNLLCLITCIVIRVGPSQPNELLCIILVFKAIPIPVTTSACWIAHGIQYQFVFPILGVKSYKLGS